MSARRTPELEAPDQASEQRSASGRRWLRKLGPSLSATVLFVVVALVGPWLVPFDAVKVNVSDRLIAPLQETRSGDIAWLGTDRLGRDMFAQVLTGARVSLLVGAATVLMAGILGTLLGIVSGYFGGTFDNVIMRLADILRKRTNTTGNL